MPDPLTEILALAVMALLAGAVLADSLTQIDRMGRVSRTNRPVEMRFSRSSRRREHDGIEWPAPSVGRCAATVWGPCWGPFSCSPCGHRSSFSHWER